MTRSKPGTQFFIRQDLGVFPLPCSWNQISSTGSIHSTTNENEKEWAAKKPIGDILAKVPGQSAPAQESAAFAWPNGTRVAWPTSYTAPIFRAGSAKTLRPHRHAVLVEVL
jgi:hypothetical protein